MEQSRKRTRPEEWDDDKNVEPASKNIKLTANYSQISKDERNQIIDYLSQTNIDKAIVKIHKTITPEQMVQTPLGKYFYSDWKKEAYIYVDPKTVVSFEKLLEYSELTLEGKSILVFRFVKFLLKKIEQVLQFPSLYPHLINQQHVIKVKYIDEKFFTLKMPSALEGKIPHPWKFEFYQSDDVVEFGYTEHMIKFMVQSHAVFYFDYHGFEKILYAIRYMKDYKKSLILPIHFKFFFSFHRPKLQNITNQVKKIGIDFPLYNNAYDAFYLAKSNTDSFEQLGISFTDDIEFDNLMKNVSLLTLASPKKLHIRTNESLKDAQKDQIIFFLTQYHLTFNKPIYFTIPLYGEIKYIEKYMLDSEFIIHSSIPIIFYLKSCQNENLTDSLKMMMNIIKLKNGIPKNWIEIQIECFIHKFQVSEVDHDPNDNDEEEWIKEQIQPPSSDPDRITYKDDKGRIIHLFYSEEELFELRSKIMNDIRPIVQPYFEVYRDANNSHILRLVRSKKFKI